MGDGDNSLMEALELDMKQLFRPMGEMFIWPGALDPSLNDFY